MQRFSITVLKRFTVKHLLLNIAVFLVYFISGKFGLSFAFFNPSASAIWAPTGIALTAIVIFGYRVIPAILIGAFFVNLTTAGTVITSVGIAFGNTLEAIVGAYLVNRFANGIKAFETVSDILRFTLFAAILSTLISASFGVLVLLLGHLTTLQGIDQTWLTWWLGDLGGNLVVAPLLFIWKTHPKFRINVLGVSRFILTFAILLITASFVFTGTIPYPYLTLPIVVWIAFWFGRRGSTVATCIVAIVAIFYTLHGIGPFVKPGSLNQSLVLVQVFISIFSLTGLIFATAVLELKKTQQNLMSKEIRFKALIENSFEAVVLVDATSKILYASPSVTRVLGYDSENLVGTTGFDLIVPEHRNKIMKELAKLVLNPGGNVTVEYQATRKDKKIIWVEATGTNLLLEPNVTAIVVNFRDITEKKYTEKKLREEKMEDEAMLTSIGDGIVATDNIGRITMINQKACDMLRCKQADVIGKFMIIVIPMEDDKGNIVPISERPIAKVLSQKKMIMTSSTIYYLRKDGTKFAVHFTLTPIIIDRKVVGTIEVFQDITKEKEVDKAKSEFVSVASHQLRTPLATINWYLEEIIKHKENFSIKQADYINEVYAASRRMVDLINALLNASRLELGTFAVKPQEVDLISLASQTIHEMQQQIQKKQITLDEKYQDQLPSTQADPKLIAIILQNLLSNALKYSPKNSSVTLNITSDANGFLISVHDSGCGIPKEQQSKIFSRMFRADNARSLEPDGTGLGLYIVKNILDVIGGSIRFESEENKGSTFFVSLPRSGMEQKKGNSELI